MTAQWTTILEVVHPNGETIFYLYTMGSRIHLRIDCNFCSVHEEITSIGLYTPGNSRNNFDQSL